MPIDIGTLTKIQLMELLARGEGHFLDFKSKSIAPSRLTKTLSAFANADGGELFVGIEDGDAPDCSRWEGFPTVESANGILQTFEEFFPLGTFFRYQFLTCPPHEGHALYCEILKTQDMRAASDQKYYLRRGAQNLPQDTPAKIERLRFNKGIVSYEDFITSAPEVEVTNSVAVLEFMLENIPTADPGVWLRKQQLIVDGRPTVAAIVLYADEPQAILPKTGIKLYRYKTVGEGSRDTLTGNPITIEGHSYAVIDEAVRRTIEIVESISVMGPGGLERVLYPRESIHEIVTNAVLHRDDSLNDEIHIRIFDNRIEVQSPGTLPAHVTVKNILDERFSRNPRIVRLINKYENPPNKDVGEGLNTAFEAMRKLKLKDPVIEQLEGAVRATLRHERLASPEEIICTYLRSHDEINNAKAREITYIGSENAVKRIFQKMMASGIIERIPGRSQAKAAYQKGPKFPEAPGA